MITVQFARTTQRARFAMLTVFALALGACGGGGGGSGSSSSGGGSSSSSSSSSSGGSATFTVSATSVAITATRLGILPSEVIITANTTDTRTAAVGAAYKAGITPAAWLDVGVTRRGTNYDFYFAVNSTGMNLDFGTYTTTVTVGSTDSAGTVLHQRDIAVTLVIRDGLRITTPGINGQGRAGDSNSLVTQTFTVVGPANTQWTATATPSWLRAPAGTQTGPGDYQATMDAAALYSGFYDSQITIVNNADPTDRATVLAHYYVQASCPYLKPFNTGGRLGGDSGLDQAPVAYEFAIPTGTNQFGWTVTGPSWMRFSATSGTASQTYQTLYVSSDFKNLAPGDYSGTMELVSNVNGERCLNPLPVQARVEANRLFVNSTGVAFSKFPSRSVLSRTLRVSDTRAEGDITWNATDDASWLTVTSTGTTAGEDGGALQITADPTGLAPGQYYAMVNIVAASAGRVPNQESVRVGLTVRTADPPVSIDISHRVLDMAANPVDPEFYATNDQQTLEVFDVYSGALLRSYPGLGATYAFAVSGDGRSVYGIAGEDLFSFDPQTGVIQKTWKASLNRGALIYARPDAHPLLLIGEGVILDLESNLVHSQYYTVSQQATLSANQRMLYGVSSYGSYRTVQAQRLRFSSVATPNVVIGFPAKYESSDDASSFLGLAASQVSNRVFVPNVGIARRVETFDGRTMTPQTPIPFSLPSMPFFAETSWNGRLAVLTTHPTDGASVSLFDDDAAPIATWNAGAGGLFFDIKTILFSGDGTRLMTGTDTAGRIHAVN